MSIHRDAVRKPPQADHERLLRELVPLRRDTMQPRAENVVHIPETECSRTSCPTCAYTEFGRLRLLTPEWRQVWLRLRTSLLDGETEGL